MSAGRQLFLDREAPFYLNRLFAYRANPHEAPLVFAGRTLPCNIGVSCTTAINPHLDDYRKRHRLDLPQPLFAACVVPSEDLTTVMLVGLADHASLLCDFVQALYDDERFEGLLNQLAFTESEDTCVNPNLWESLSEDTQQQALNAMRHDLFRGPATSHPRVIRIPRGRRDAT